MPTIAAPSDLVRVLTPKGHEALFAARRGTSDGALVSGIIGEDEYDLKDLPELTGWAICIGAHIGTVAVVLAVDHPGLDVVAVEALPENYQQLRENVALNGLTGVHPIHAAAGAEGEISGEVVYGWSRADNQPDLYMQDNRFIGGMVGANETSSVAHCDAISLRSIIDEFTIETIELLQIDCEGCEWRFLTSSEIKRCKRIWGEYHEALNPENTYARLLELLEPTHDVEHIRGTNVGIFRATRR